MSATIGGIIVLTSTFGGALIGQWLRTILPEQHLIGESRDTVKVGIALVATMTALVLGLVTASAKDSFETADRAATHYAVDVLTLDRLLATYGPETADLRAALRLTIGSRIEMLRSKGSSRNLVSAFRPEEGLGAEGLADAIRRLVPRDDSQRALQSQAASLVESFLRARWLVAAGGGSSIPVPFLGTLTFWLTITFASFGLFAPRNLTVLAALFVCALSVASAMFLILEMDGPFDGWLRISAEPLLYAQAHLDQ